MAIQVVYFHYMLTPFVECLWYVKFDTFVWSKKIVNRMKDQRTSYGANDKCSSVQQVCVLDLNRHTFEKKTGPIHLALVGLTAGAGRWNAGGNQNSL